MLRPACLLPAARLPPRVGLLTLRFGIEDLSSLREPATRRVAAYRYRTFTGWTFTARRRFPGPALAGLSDVVTTHHAPSVDPQRLGRSLANGLLVKPETPQVGSAPRPCPPGALPPSRGSPPRRSPPRSPPAW